MYVSLPLHKQQKSTFQTLDCYGAAVLFNNASVLLLLPMIYHQSFLLLLPSKSDPLTFSLSIYILSILCYSLNFNICPCPSPAPLLSACHPPVLPSKFCNIYESLLLLSVLKATNSTVSTTKTPSFFLLIFHHFIDTSDGNVLKNKLLLFFSLLFLIWEFPICFLCLLSGRSKQLFPFSPILCLHM